jgi:hypothetical protein
VSAACLRARRRPGVWRAWLVLLQLWWMAASAAAQPAQDYRFDSGVTHEITLAQASGQLGFVWPERTGRWDTALLALEVHAEGQSRASR